MDCSLPALFMGFPRQEYWSGMPFPPLGYLPDPGIKPVSSTLAEKCFTVELPGKPLYMWFADVQLLNHAWLLGTPWTVIHQAPLSMGFSRQEYWSGLLFPTPGDLPKLGIKPASLISPALAGRFFTSAPTRKSNSSSGTVSLKFLFIPWIK